LLFKPVIFNFSLYILHFSLVVAEGHLEIIDVDWEIYNS